MLTYYDVTSDQIRSGSKHQEDTVWFSPYIFTFVILSLEILKKKKKETDTTFQSLTNPSRREIQSLAGLRVNHRSGEGFSEQSITILDFCQA